MAYFDAVTRLGPGGPPRTKYVGFTVREPSGEVAEDFFFGPDHDFQNDDEIILAVIKDFVRRAA